MLITRVTTPDAHDPAAKAMSCASELWPNACPPKIMKRPPESWQVRRVREMHTGSVSHAACCVSCQRVANQRQAVRPATLLLALDPHTHTIALEASSLSATSERASTVGILSPFARALSPFDMIRLQVHPFLSPHSLNLLAAAQ